MRDLHCLLGLVKICFHFLIFYPGWIEQEKKSPFLPHRYCYFYPVLFKYLSWFPCVFNFNQESSCKTIPLGNFYVWSFWSIFERLMGYNIVHKMCSHQILEVILLVGDSNYKKLFCFFFQPSKKTLYLPANSRHKQLFIHLITPGWHLAPGTWLTPGWHLPANHPSDLNNPELYKQSLSKHAMLSME